MTNKFPQRHPIEDGQDWEMAEWLQLFLYAPEFWRTKQFLDVLQAFPSPERLAPWPGPVAPGDVICRNANFLSSGIENFVELAEDGNNQALLALARLAVFTCDALSNIFDQDQKRVVFISKRMPVWPINWWIGLTLLKTLINF